MLPPRARAASACRRFPLRRAARGAVTAHVHAPPLLAGPAPPPPGAATATRAGRVPHRPDGHRARTPARAGRRPSVGTPAPCPSPPRGCYDGGRPAGGARRRRGSRGGKARGAPGWVPRGERGQRGQHASRRRLGGAIARTHTPGTRGLGGEASPLRAVDGWMRTPRRRSGCNAGCRQISDWIVVMNCYDDTPLPRLLLLCATRCCRRS